MDRRAAILSTETLDWVVLVVVAFVDDVLLVVDVWQVSLTLLERETVVVSRELGEAMGEQV